MTTPKIIFEEKIARHLTENNEVGQDVNATYQFNISSHTSLHSRCLFGRLTTRMPYQAYPQN